MLSHTSEAPVTPSRVVVLGAGGFVGGRITQKLEAQSIDVLALARADVDLSSEGASEALSKVLREDDVLVFAAAKAPVKNTAMLTDNMILLQNVVAALQKTPVAYVLNIGSDAVFADSEEPLTEWSVKEPGALHGVMHLAREVALEADQSSPFGTIRPTLIYGAGDPHNGYGPNRFARLAKAGETITLFGNGEERRDHIHVDDVAELAVRMILHRSVGSLNAATGTVISFHDIAQRVIEDFGSSSLIETTVRSGPMPHNGYRPFAVGQIGKAFSGFEPATFDQRVADLRKI